MSGSSFFVVDHVSDPNKKDGIVESYTMVNVQYDTDEGTVQGVKRLNFVHWPDLPVPFVHEEWSENLEFSNVYVPELDNADGDEDEEEYEEEEYLDEEDGEASFSDEVTE